MLSKKLNVSLDVSGEIWARWIHLRVTGSIDIIASKAMRLAKITKGGNGDRGERSKDSACRLGVRRNQ